MTTIYHKNKLICHSTHCSTLFSRLRGLMFTSKLKKRTGILMDTTNERINSIHMFFVFYPLDIIWLDKHHKIVDIRRNVQPFTPLIIPKKPSQYVLEMNKGETKALRIGDRLTVTFKNN